MLFKAPAVVLATGGIGNTFKVTSNSWEYTGDGHALALLAGATLVNMECIQFHPTGMVWPPSVKGILVTESVRGDGGVLRNTEGKRFMFDYVPDVFRKQYAETEEEADRWYTDPDNNRRPPELLPRDEVARSINSEVKAGRGTPNGGVLLDIAAGCRPRRSASGCRRCTTSSRSWPTSTSRRSRWRSGRPATTSWAASRSTRTPPRRSPACSRRRVLRRHARLQPAGRQLAVGPAGLRPPGRLHAAEYVDTLGAERRRSTTPRSTRRPSRRRWPRWSKPDGENPYTLHHELQVTMNELVGIIRKQEEVQEALVKIEEFKPRPTSSARPAAAASTRAGTSPWTSATC